MTKQNSEFLAAEAALPWSAQQLMGSAYRLAVEAASSGMFVCDAQGVFTLVNPALEQITGYSADQLVGKRRFESLHDPAELALRHDELLMPPARDIIGTLPNAPFVASLGASSEWTYIRANGSPVSVNLALTRLSAADGGIEGYVGTVLDNSPHATQHGVRLWHLLHHDPLTGLPTQELLEERLGMQIERAKANKEPVLLVLLELDNLRKLRDSLGQTAADTAIKHVANHLKLLAGDDHVVALIRGSLFALAATGHSVLSGKREAELLAEIARPIPYQSTYLHLSASLGVSSFPIAGDDPGALIHRALLALHEANVSGGGTARHFDFAMQRQSTRRSRLESLLRDAVQNRQFGLVYQPQVNLQTGRITRAETLLRWHHPQLGAVGPAEFIPLAEDIGLMHELGEWVLNTACQQAARMLAMFGESPRVAINVSPTQLRDQKLFDAVELALEKWRLPAHCLELEITEGVLLDNTRHAVDTLDRLRSLGVEIAIDDFGTGYSSLSYLTRFPVNRIKIDRSLVQAISAVKNGDAIISAIVGMAHALDIKVTAEGVETEAHAERLRELGCDEAQGYWFSRPLTAQALENALRPIA